MSRPSFESIFIKNIFKLNSESFADLDRANDDYDAFDRHELASYEGLAWILGFVDLVYVAMIFKVEQLLADCGETYGVYVMALSLFTLMFTTRFHLDTYSALHVRVDQKACYPLLQSDMFHRVVILCYSFGSFIMAMNIAFDVSSEEGAHTAERRILAHMFEQSNSSSSTTENDHFAAETTDEADFGHCVCMKDFSYGIAYGFITTRFLMVLLYSAVAAYASDPALKKYSTLFRLKIALTSCSLLIMCTVFAVEPSQTVYIFPIIAVWEFVTLVLPDILPPYVKQILRVKHSLKDTSEVASESRIRGSIVELPTRNNSVNQQQY